jgi:hypothetical protein
MLGYQSFFIERANIFTVCQHMVLLVIRHYEGKRYHLFVEDWLVEAYYLRIIGYPVITTTYAPPHYTTALHKWYNINRSYVYYRPSEKQKRNIISVIKQLFGEHLTSSQ